VKLGERLGAMVAAIVGAARLSLPLGDRGRTFSRRNKVARRKAVSYTQRLYAKQAASRLERYGLDVAGDKATVIDCRRRLRNARKLERHAPPPKFGTPPKAAIQPCRVFWGLKTNAARRKHMRGTDGCKACIAFVRAEANARGLA
jgi:hypothetical protein